MTRVQPYDLTVEQDPRPLGVDAKAPRFGWKVRGPGRATASRVRVYEESSPGPGEEVWDSGPIASDAVLAAYGGRPLHSQTLYRWCISLRDERGAWSRSQSGDFETAFLEPGGLHSPWITASARAVPVAGSPDAAQAAKPPRYFRRPFELTAPPCRARLYVTAAGVYVPYLNGERVGRRELSPGWTDYRKRYRYQTYDVTDALTMGENLLAFIVGDGWFAGYIGFGRARAHYGEDPAVLAELHLWDAAGHRTVIGTGPDWRAGGGPILYSDLLMGEAYDGARETAGWAAPGTEPDAFGPVEIWDPGPVLLVSDRTPPVTVRERRGPVLVEAVAPGTHMLDFGQNLVGRPVLDTREIRGPVRLRFGEVRDDRGRLYTENLREAAQTDIYIGCEGASTPYRPTFTFHGFRYLEVTGWPGMPGSESIQVEVLATEQPDTGAITFGEPMLDRLVANIGWSQRANLLFVPTDCPQRDERLGWLGDAQVFIETAAWNQDVRRFFEDWLDTVADGQSSAGPYPDVAPRVVDESDGAPGWADAGIIVPWTLYQLYGDPDVLRRQVDGMERYVGWLVSENPEGLWTHHRQNDFGDWLSVGEDAPKELLATAFFAEDARILAEVSRVLGRPEAVRHWHGVRDRVREAYRRAFVDQSGRVAGDTQTGYALTLAFDLAPTALRERVAAHLRENLRRHGERLTTGFLGIAHLLPALSQAGYDDAAWSLVRATRYPSWGYEILHGATTIWERWDGWTAERGFQTPIMNSFNHYAFGAVGAWMYRYAAGICPQAPGFAELAVAPHVPRGPARIDARFDSVRGRIHVKWRSDGERVRLEVETPPSIKAAALIPAADPDRVEVAGTVRPGRFGEHAGRLRIPLKPGRVRIAFSAPRPDSSPS